MSAMSPCTVLYCTVLYIQPMTRISSTGLLSHLYPDVAGLYSKVEVGGTPGRGRGPVRRLQVYRKTSTGGTQFYISRPEAAIGVDKEHAS